MPWPLGRASPARPLTRFSLAPTRYFEGYFHVHGSTGLPVVGINPRRGFNMSKPAAPLAMRALIVSLRQKNASVLQ